MTATMMNVMLMAQSGQGGQQGSMASFLVPMAIIFVVFYFLLIRPQQKQQKKVREMLSSLKKGDEVITRSGIHGRVTGIADTLVTVEIADNCKIKMNRDQVALIKERAAG